MRAEKEEAPTRKEKAKKEKAHQMWMAEVEEDYTPSWGWE